MVQMKVHQKVVPAFFVFVFISHMVQMKGSTPETTDIYESRLYIPHGSDERASTEAEGREVPALYPTWFR